MPVVATIALIVSPVILIAGAYIVTAGVMAVGSEDDDNPGIKLITTGAILLAVAAFLFGAAVYQL